MRAAAVKPDAGAPVVLVVDDEPGPRESLELVLKPYFHVLTVPGGQEALEVIRTYPVDVVTLDLKMGGLSGPETLARIRQIEPDLEVVIVTGYGSFESAVEVLRLRAFDYIAKPFESGRILDVVRRAALSRRNRRVGVEVEQVLPPLSEILEDVERWQRSVSGRLAELDRATLDRILLRLQALRARVGDRARRRNAHRKETE